MKGQVSGKFFLVGPFCLSIGCTTGYYTRVFVMFKDTQAVDSDRST